MKPISSCLDQLCVCCFFLPAYSLACLLVLLVVDAAAVSVVAVVFAAAVLFVALLLLPTATATIEKNSRKQQ